MSRPQAPAAGSVFLIGYRGSGKTSVGSALARLLDATFLDLDRLIETEAGKSINRLFAEESEERFRDLEGKSVEAVSRRARKERIVVATGGGVVLRASNVNRLRESGTVVWLQAEPEILRARILADPRSVEDRPSLSGSSAADEVETVLARRLDLYRTAAHLVMPTGNLPVEDVAARIRAELPAYDRLTE